MEHVSVKSSFIRTLGHDEESQKMEVRLKDGKSYTYEGVTTEDFESIRDAESVGKAYNQFIQNR